MSASYHRTLVYIFVMYSACKPELCVIYKVCFQGKVKKEHTMLLLLKTDTVHTQKLGTILMNSRVLVSSY